MSAENKTFRVTVFGKSGCDKCKVLNHRLDELLGKPEWSEFEKEYCDVETEDGLIVFCRSECINPNRIPAMLVSRWNAETGRYERIPNPQPGRPHPVLRSSQLYTWLGLQTDYTDAGRGLLPPPMLTAVLDAARTVAP
jgi:hypothetical protein